MSTSRPASGSRTASGAPAGPPLSAGAALRVLAVCAGLLGLLVWCYWPVVMRLYKDLSADPNYSVGKLVPLAALYLLWHDRAALRRCRLRPCWWGVGVILFALAARYVGLRDLYESVERYALLLTLAGLVLLVAGREVFWRVRWLLAFMLLMVPLPNVVHARISDPLQTWATAGTVFALELSGMTVSREGNVMVLNDTTPLAVAEACSGLRMLTAFVVVAAVLAYIVGRPFWQKAVLLASSVPIAILANIVRMVVTALLFVATSADAAETFFHDFAGVSMMPVAVLVLVGELALMNKLILPERPASPTPRPGRSSAPPRPAHSRPSGRDAARG